MSLLAEFDPEAPEAPKDLTEQRSFANAQG